MAGWTEHTEEYEHVGRVRGYVSSLPDVWTFVRQQNENKALQRDAWLSLSVHSKAPPAIVWDQLVNPVSRTRWMQVNGTEVVEDKRGRIGPGAEYHCAHGEDNDIAVLTVLDMRAVDYMTLLSSIGDGMALRYTDYVIPSGVGTKIVSYAAPLFNPETGENLSDEVLAELAERVGDPVKATMERLSKMAHEVSASIVPC